MATKKKPSLFDRMKQKKQEFDNIMSGKGLKDAVEKSKIKKGYR